jgi:hypothetical protein
MLDRTRSPLRWIAPTRQSHERPTRSAERAGPKPPPIRLALPPTRLSKPGLRAPALVPAAALLLPAAARRPQAGRRRCDPPGAVRRPARCAAAAAALPKPCRLPRRCARASLSRRVARHIEQRLDAMLRVPSRLTDFDDERLAVQFFGCVEREDAGYGAVRRKLLIGDPNGIGR